MEGLAFKELKNNFSQFFDLLPIDWQNDIVPYWNTVSNFTKIYVIKNNTEILGGGMVFKKLPPLCEYFEDDAAILFQNGYLYLGFIWVEEKHRNKNLGSLWLNRLKSELPNQNYFLLTEDAHLQHFYEKNDFTFIKSVLNEDQLESLYITKVEKSNEPMLLK